MVVVGGMTQDEADTLSNSVPSVTRDHFDDLMSKARRWVSLDIIAQHGKDSDAGINRAPLSMQNVAV